MKRRSRIAEVIAAVPTAAQAACRMKSRRLYLEKDCWSIKLPLDSIVWRAGDEMEHRPDTVHHFLSGRRGIRQRGNVADDLAPDGRGKLTAAKQRVQAIDACANVGIGGEASGEPRLQIEHDRAVSVIEARQPIGGRISIAAVGHNDAPLQIIHLPHGGGVGSELEFRGRESSRTENS